MNHQLDDYKYDKIIDIHNCVNENADNVEMVIINGGFLLNTWHKHKSHVLKLTTDNQII